MPSWKICTNTTSIVVIKQQVKSVQSAFNEVPLAIKQAKHHRWLSHEQAISSVVRSYKFIVADLESSSINEDPVGQGILKHLKEPFILRTLLFLADVLPHISNLSLFFQRRDVHFGLVKATVDKTLRLLEKKKSQDGPWLLKDGVIRDQLGISESTDSSKFLIEVRQPFIDGLIQNIEDRFQDIEVIDQLAILDLSGTKDLPSMYGLNEIEGLAQHFNLDSEKLKIEWEDFLQLVNTTQPTHRSMSYLVELLFGKKKKKRIERTLSNGSQTLSISNCTTTY